MDDGRLLELTDSVRDEVKHSRTTPAIPEMVFAFRGDRAPLWVAAPLGDTSPEVRRLLGLAAVVAAATGIAYFADVKLTDGGRRRDAVLRLSFVLDARGHVAEVELLAWPYERRRLGRLRWDQPVLMEDTRVFGSLIDDLSASLGEYGKPSIRAAGLGRLLESACEVAVEPELEAELATIIDSGP